jgi:hypothetical protein
MKNGQKVLSGFFSGRPHFWVRLSFSLRDESKMKQKFVGFEAKKDNSQHDAAPHHWK